MNIRKMILGLVVAVATSAFGAWFDNPTVQATVQLGHANTGAQYINLSEEGVYLMVNTHRDNDNYPVP